MNEKILQSVHRVTALFVISAIIFYLFFQVSKNGVSREINPFGNDPYDAVGSFAYQLALLIGLLTYARVLRFRYAPEQAANKVRLILRGNITVLVAIAATLIADAVAEIRSRLLRSYWGDILRVELGTMVLIALVCAIALAVVFGRIRTAVPPADLILADGIDDLWTLVRVPVTKLSAALPRIIVDWVERFSSDRFFARVRWVNPRTHSWRFACILGLLVGAGLAVAQLKDGAPSLRIGLLVAGIFISTEFGATLAGYAFLGSYLGLRPFLFKDKR